MMQRIGAYFIGIAAAAMAVSLAEACLRRGALRRVVRLAGGVVLILTVLGPLVRLNLDSFGQYIAGVQLEEDARRTGVEVRRSELLCRIIQEKTEAYILDKAEALGASVEAEVTVAQGTDYPYPEAVTVTGTLTEDQRRALRADLAASLAIPEERQVYRP